MPFKFQVRLTSVHGSADLLIDSILNHLPKVVLWVLTLAKFITTADELAEESHLVASSIVERSRQ